MCCADLVVHKHSYCVADKQNLIRIGRNCEIYGGLISQEEGKIIIGDNTIIHSDYIIGSVCSVSIGNCVIISNNIHIYDNNNHPIDPKVRERMHKENFYGEKWKWKYSDSKSIVIEDNVWIGERSTILKGVIIGKGSIVASNSVVTKDVPTYSIVAGNLARVVKKMENKYE